MPDGYDAIDGYGLSDKGYQTSYGADDDASYQGSYDNGLSDQGYRQSDWLSTPGSGRVSVESDAVTEVR